MADSWDARARSRLHRQRARLLCDELYKKPPTERLGFMATIIQAAREDDWHLRIILTDRGLLASYDRDYAGRLNITHAAENYCRRLWGHGVIEVVTKVCPEPDTGEVGMTGEHRKDCPKAPDQNAPYSIKGKPDGDPEVHIAVDAGAFLAWLRAERAKQTGDQVVQAVDQAA